MLKIAYHPIYNYSLPEGHRFPMEKYELLPKYLLDNAICTQQHFFEPGKVSEAPILRVHTRDYYSRLLALEIDKKEIRKMGFPLRKELVERGHYIIDGTIQGCKYALQHGVAMNIAGGTHHAYADHGEAFCLLNDQAVAAQYLLDHKLAEKILMVDLDVHQGNGTASIFKDEPRVFTFSMHGAGNYPFKKEQSDLDIPLDDGTDDQTFMNTLKSTLPLLLTKVNPDFIFFLSGVDILETDRLGRLSCTLAGCEARDRFVLQMCKDHHIPLQISMGGGYSKNIEIIVEAHANTFKAAQKIFFDL